MHRWILYFIIACIGIISCTDENVVLGRIIVTTGIIDMNEVVFNQDCSVASASGSVSIQGQLPNEYKVVCTGVIYGIDSSELGIASCQIYDAPGHYDDYLGVWRYYNYKSMGRSVVVNIVLTEGSITPFYIRESFGDSVFVCPLINLPRGTKLYIRAFAHISNEMGDDKYIYGRTKEFISPGIYQDPSVYTEISALRIGISKLDVEIRNGQDAQIYCSRMNFDKYGGYNDWRLPTVYELKEIYKFRNSIGDFSSTRYFSCEGWGEEGIYFWYWDFATNEAGHEELHNWQWGRLRLIRDI